MTANSRSGLAPRNTAVKGVELSDDDPHDVRRQKLARIIVDSMYQFLGLLDAAGNVIEVNQAALEGAGVDLHEVVGKPFWETRWWTKSEETRERVRSMVSEAAAGRFVRCDIEIFGEHKGQRTIVVDFSLKPIFDDAGKVAFLLPEGRNVSEKIAIEAELTRRNKEVHAALEKLREIDGFKTRFFANVSHELRTPLTLILGPVSQLLGSNEFSERERFRLLTIKRNAGALLQQVNDLLDLGRIDAGEMPLVYVYADIVALARGVAEGFESAAQERGVRLSFAGEDELHVDVDQAKFVRVVSNLLANAFKFTPDSGRIRCSFERLSGNRVLMSIQDSGPGVPDERKESVFDRYAQGADELAAKGSGLGLNIVKEFVELHHGTITLLDAPERGALFQIELPLRAPAGAFVRARDSQWVPPIETIQSAPESGLTDRPEKAGSPRLLIVEDNSDLRQFLYDVLTDDYQVTLAENGRVALEIVHEKAPDLIITDLMMPEMDGERFVHELRQRQTAHIPVLVLSARADDVLRETLLDGFVQDYLTKPFSPRELRARVRNLVTVKRTVDILQKELDSQASDIGELTNGLIASRKSLLDGIRALQISERRWLGFYENTAVGIALVNADGKIMKANPALQQMLGYSQQEILGISLLDLTEASERAATRQNVYSLLKGGRGSYQLQKRYMRRDGSFLWAKVCASVIPLVDREGPRIAVIVEDLSAQKSAEDALAKTRADLTRVARLTTMGELAASIAHEVNQPLAAIVTNSQAALRWLEREEPDYDEVVQALQRVRRDATHAADVITRIRGFLKKEGLKREQVDVPRMIDALVQMLQPTLNHAAVNLDVYISTGLPPLMGDQVQLQQVILNLVMNALDAMRNQTGRDRRIRIEVHADAVGTTFFSVRDSGPGVPADMTAAIFEPFHSTKSDGLGMGLAISKSIVESHRGKLWLDVSSPEGACFIFSIPAQGS
ncbi:MAG TPA: ATP-binding protein [Aromatoleum sp.]|uniref:ATP-binding protein n=1 Tax=Aromatoleum sp. TaxID=2307007 RepID=UPI002B48F1B8|nr:ATP-binding protein [Aromatoleum sp.]HJV24538.1 ATP-binding protein [Aromatoleum sp.]